jgi:hypothetical protein
MVALALVAFVSCKPAAVKPGDPGREPDATLASPAGAVAGSDDAPATIPADPECAGGGRPWDGKPKDCAYEHGKCCYTEAEQACAAAGCTAGKCIVMETYPAQVRCEG